ncbi:MAG: prepilin-type N-terminal cleavage/methylation domain-containing protein [Planctomycetales bacterium]|nr:prepilin-type N-terminal cleavage/methylation domain-containing protein [Planctomycetales bacterium]
MKRIRNNKAFTLIELLTVVAIIAMLIAMFGAGMRKVKIVQVNLQQKASFRAGEVALELFSKDFGEYPDSSLVSDGGKLITGTQRVAEALFGRDDKGFHPRSKWHPGLDKDAGSPFPGVGPYTDATLKDRKTPYFERKRAGFYTVNDLWNASGFGSSSIYTSAGASSGTDLAPIFTDLFLRNKVTLPSGDSAKVGMPILYYKADSTKRFRVNAAGTAVNPVTIGQSAEYSQWVYNFMDNLPVLQLPWLRDPADPIESGDIPPHYPDESGAGKEPVQIFYEQITQRQDGVFFKPHNPSTYILISAGWDGIYGTKDDLTNFND